jgi:hypothetical protein
LQNTSLFVGHAATTDLQKGKATVNLLRCIDKLPQSLANDLSRVELQEIMDVFQFGNRFLSTLASFHANDELGKSAVTDLTYSARYCLDRQLGQSRWASLQAAEKLIKLFIQKKNKTFPHTHDLAKLRALACSVGWSFADDETLNGVQCGAEVRYGQGQQRMTDVVKAHLGAVQVGASIMSTLHPVVAD